MKNLLKQVTCAVKLRLTTRRAAVAIMVALSAPVLLGMAGLVTDVTYWYGSRQAMQLAADAGAMAAARSGQSSQSTLQTVAVNAANLATNNQYSFNSNNLVVTVNNGGSSFQTPAGNQPVTSQATFSTVTVLAKTPAPVFFSAILGMPQSTLAASASSTLQKNIVPPTNSTLLALTGNAGPTFHVGGLNFIPSGTVGSNLTSVGLAGGNSGAIFQGSNTTAAASYITNNNNQVNNNNTGNIDLQSAPPCAQLLAQAGGLVDGNGNMIGNATSYTTNSIISEPWTDPYTGNTVQLYFGAGSSVSVQPGYGWYNNGPSYQANWSPVIVSPKTTVDGNLRCAPVSGNTPSATCTIPAAAYCGGLQVDPGSTIVFTDPNNDGQSFLIVDGNAVLPNSSVASYVSYTNQDSQYGFYFGGSQVGGLLNTTQADIYPGQIQQGVVSYTTTESQTYYNPGDRAFTIPYADQVCPFGVLPSGLTSNSNAVCTGPVQTPGTSGTINTSTVGANAPTTNGDVTANYYVRVPAHGYETVTDTYVTSVTFTNGNPIYAGAVETTYVCGGRQPCQQTGDPTSTISSGNYIPASMQGDNPPPASSLSCSSGSKNNLYNSVTSPNVGSSSNSGYTSQTDSIEVCGSGPPLQAIAVGGSILISAATSSNLWMSD